MVARAVASDGPEHITSIVLEDDMLARIATFRRSDEGATAVEYGLMVALIAVAIVGTVTALGIGLNGLFTQITGSL